MKSDALKRSGNALRSAKVDVDKLAQEIRDAYNIDLQNYYRPEIAEHLGEIVVPLRNLKKMFVNFAAYVLYAIIACVVAWALVEYIDASFLWQLFIAPYVIIGFLICGILTSLYRLAAGFIDNIVGLITVGIEIAESASQDITRYSAGEIKADPEKGSPRLLLRGAIYIVVLPTVEKLLAGKIFVLSKIVMWALRRALVDSFVLMFLSDKELQEKLRTADGVDPNLIIGEEAPQEASKTAGQIKSMADDLKVYRERIVYFSAIIKKHALLPFRVIIFIFVMLFGISLLLFFGALGLFSTGMESAAV